MSFILKYPRTSHIGHTVSHAKNRGKRGFKYNLQTVTILINGQKMRLKVPAKVVKQLKKEGVTTHYKKVAE